MQFTEPRRYADPAVAARRLLEIAHAVEPGQEGRIFIEKINYPMLYKDGATPGEYWAGLQFAIEQGWLSYHESGTFVTFTPAGADLFA